MSRLWILLALGSLAAPVAVSSQAPGDPAVPLSAVLTLADAIGRAEARNPELQSARFHVEAAEARIRQAGSRPNPEAGIEVENWGGTRSGFSQSEITASLSQVLELGGKRDARVRAARAEAGSVGSDVNFRRLEIAAEVVRRFFEMQAAQEAIGLQAEGLRISDEIRTSIARRVEAGAISPAERTRADIDYENALLLTSQAEQNLALARLRLASTWGDPEPGDFNVSAAAGTPLPMPDAPPLPEIVETSPGVARARRELEMRQAQVSLSRAERVPDLEISGGYRALRESDDHAFVAGIALPLPVFNRNQAAVAEARALAAGAEADLARRRLEITRQLGETFAAIGIAHGRAETLRERIIPAANDALDEIRTGYERGRFSYVDLLEARRAWTDARRDEVLARLEYHLAVSDLEVLLGRSLVHPMPVPDGGDAR